MMTEEEALRRISRLAPVLPSEEVPIGAASGRFAAADVAAEAPLPRFHNSSMDGYAVRAADCLAGARLRIAGVQPAGRVQQLSELQPGEAVRIYTGALIPPGADAVIMQEDVRDEDGQVVVVMAPVAHSENIRFSGCDVCRGQNIISRGERITPSRVALLAAQGALRVAVGSLPATAVLSTGDELAPPGDALDPGMIYDGNGPMLAALVQQAGAKISNIARVHDEPSALAAALRHGLESDVLLVSGGVSVGARDFVKQQLRELGAEPQIWRVSIKPGKPFLFARAGPCLVFGLPGNPVSAFVTFHLFVRPAFLQLMGAAPTELRPRTARALTDSDLENPGERPHYVRGLLTGGTFSAVGRQESHAVFGLSRSNTLVRVAPGTTVRCGEEVSALLLD